MATTKELLAKIAELEGRLASTGETGKIWPDISKACKDGHDKDGNKVTHSTMVLRGVNSNPQKTVNMYPSQFARLLPQLPTICKKMLVPALWAKFSFRSEDEKTNTEAVLVAYISEGESDGS